MYFKTCHNGFIAIIILVYGNISGVYSMFHNRVLLACEMGSYSLAVIYAFKAIQTNGTHVLATVGNEVLNEKHFS